MIHITAQSWTCGPNWLVMQDLLTSHVVWLMLVWISRDDVEAIVAIYLRDDVKQRPHGRKCSRGSMCDVSAFATRQGLM